MVGAQDSPLLFYPFLFAKGRLIMDLTSKSVGIILILNELIIFHCKQKEKATLNRRQFLGATLALGAGVAAHRGEAKTNLFMKLFSGQPEIIIVGSGYGGAVAALRLTKAGHKVTLLEMGVDYEKRQEYKPFSNMLSPKNNSTWLRNKTIAPMMNMVHFSKKFTGVLDRMDFEEIKVYAGRGVGGGSLVNGGMAVQPKKEFFREVFPELDANEFWEVWYPTAKKELKVNEIPQHYLESSDYYKFARVGIDEAKHAGFKTITVPNVYSFDYMQKEEAGEVPKSALAKEIIYGNNYGKNSLEKTYLKKALATGLLTILDLHKVNYFEPTKKGYKVYVEEINTSGITVKKKVMHCQKLFINGGSLGTTQILLASQYHAKLNRLDKSVGHYWGNNGNIMAGRNMVNTAFNRVKGDYDDTYGRGTGDKQSAIPIAGIDNWDDQEHTFFAEISPLPMGMEVYTSLYLLLNKLPHLGQIKYVPGKKDIELVWGEKNYKHNLENAKYFIKTMNKANGGTPAGLLWNLGYGPDICYHPLGGAVLGKTTDLYGRVKGYEDLYIMDGSLIPGAIGVNPFLTITAIAEYCMDDIIKKDFK